MSARKTIEVKDFNIGSPLPKFYSPRAGISGEQDPSDDPPMEFLLPESADRLKRVVIVIIIIHIRTMRQTDAPGTQLGSSIPKNTPLRRGK
jgi:hypothetical protein